MYVCFSLLLRAATAVRVAGRGDTSQLAGGYRLWGARYGVIFALDEHRRRISIREVGHSGSIY